MAVNFAGIPQPSSGYGKTCTVLLPAGIQPGEKLKIAFSKNLDTADDMSAPIGWAEVDSHVRAYHCLQKVYERVADGSEGASVVLTHAKNSDWSAIAFRSDSLGVGDNDNTNEVLGVGDIRTCPDITTTQAHSSVLRLITIRDAGSNIAAVADIGKPGGLIPLGEVLGNGTYTAIVYSDHASVEAVGTADFSMPDDTNSYSVLATTLELLGTANATLHSLTDVDTDEETEDGQQNVSFDFASALSDPTSLVYTNGTHNTANLLVSDSNGSGTFNLPDISSLTADAPGVPFTSASHSILAELSDGTNTATLSVTHNPKTGWAVTEFAEFIAGPNTLFNEGETIPDTSQMLAPSAVSFNPDGTVETDLTSFKVVYFKATTGIWEVMNVNFNGGQPQEPTASFITAMNMGPADTQLFTLNTKTNPDQWEGEGGSPILPKP